MASNLPLCFVLLLLSLLSLLLLLLLLFRKINLVSFLILRNKARLLHFLYKSRVLMIYFTSKRHNSNSCGEAIKLKCMVSVHTVSTSS